MNMQEGEPVDVSGWFFACMDGRIVMMTSADAPECDMLPLFETRTHLYEFCSADVCGSAVVSAMQIKGNKFLTEMRRFMATQPRACKIVCNVTRYDNGRVAYTEIIAEADDVH